MKRKISAANIEGTQTHKISKITQGKNNTKKIPSNQQGGWFQSKHNAGLETFFEII